MKARFLIEEPEKVEFTLKLTMTAKEWEQLRDQLQEKWPSARLSRAITSILTNVRATHYPEQDALI